MEVQAFRESLSLSRHTVFYQPTSTQEQLILTVFSFRLLYDTSHSDYRDVNRKAVAWESVIFVLQVFFNVLQVSHHYHLLLQSIWAKCSDASNWRTLLSLSALKMSKFPLISQPIKSVGDK